MSDETLKPCPFCGADAYHGMPRSDDGGSYVDRWQVACTVCPANLIVIDADAQWPHGVISQAVEKWNTRVAT